MVRIRPLLCVGLALLAWGGIRPVQAEETLGPDGFPAEWRVEDFAFSMLEPAAGQSSASVVPNTMAGLVQVISGTGGSSAPQTGPKTFDVNSLPRESTLPSGTIALPPPMAQGLLAEEGGSSSMVFRPLGQALPQQRPRSVAADLGIMVTEQPMAGQAGGWAELARYGPLSAAAFANEAVWAGADAALQRQRLLQATDQPLASFALREVYRRLLLADVAPPLENETEPHWLAVRAEALERMGWTEAAWSLWRQAGPLLRQPHAPVEILQGWARASLLAGQTEAACALVREQAAAGMVSDFWPSAAGACAALELGQSGNPAALTLAIQLLPPRVMEEDPGLVGALNAVRDNISPTLKGHSGRAWPITPLGGAVLMVMPEAVAADDIALLPDVALRRMRETASLPLPQRVAAARGLVAQTGWPDDAARWWALVSSPTAPSVPNKSWPDAAVVVWAEQVSGSLVVSGTLAGDNAPSLAAAAPMVVTAALRLGNPEVAAQWLPLWQMATAPRSPQAYWQSLLALHGFTGGDISPTLTAWIAVRGTDRVANQRVLAVLEGLGFEVPTAAWAAVASSPDAPSDALNLAWQRLLENAAAQRDIPGVLSMVADAMRGQNAAGVAPAVLKASLTALRQIGLNEVARQLAAESLTLTPVAQATVRVLALDSPSESVMMVASASAPIAKPVAPKPPIVPVVSGSQPQPTAAQ